MIKYKLEKGKTYVAVVETISNAAIYDDISDLTPKQQRRLVQLYNRDESMTWDKAWDIITKEITKAH